MVTGEGVEAAMDAVDAVVHAATSPMRRAATTEVVGTTRMVDSSERVGAHFVYVSIVGVDRNRLPYYRAKSRAERLVESSRSRWTIQRATQFHDLLDGFLEYPVFPKAPGLAFQLVDTGEVAAQLADVVDLGPSGRLPDFGGPEILGIEEIAAVRREITGRRARLVPVPRVGPMRDFVAGTHLCPENRSGRITWRDWLLRQTAGA